MRRVWPRPSKPTFYKKRPLRLGRGGLLLWQERKAHVGHLVDRDHHTVANPLAQHGNDGIAEEGGGVAGALFLAEPLVGLETFGHG